MGFFELVSERRSWVDVEPISTGKRCSRGLDLVRAVMIGTEWVWMCDACLSSALATVLVVLISSARRLIFNVRVRGVRACACVRLVRAGCRRVCFPLATIEAQK